MTYVVVGLVALLLIVAGITWVLAWTPVEKEWCVMMYYVARHDSYQAPLDPKLQDVIDQHLWKLPCATPSGESSEPIWKQAHVVYRAIWNNSSRPPDAKVVHWKPFAPKATTFPGVTLGDDLTPDLHAFFNWAYVNCPARHYAVFFWGHSFGPGGIFEIGQPVVVDPPPRPLVLSALSLLSVSKGLEAIAERRRAAWAPKRDIRLYQQQTQTPSEPPPPPPAPPPLKVEAVLFQDCWMSTLESMYALQAATRYVIGSQSLIPIGLGTGNATVSSATWPYKGMIDGLLTKPAFADALLNELKAFYTGPQANRDPDPWVPMSLLDLGEGTAHVETTLSRPFRDLVAALGPLGKLGRRQLIHNHPVETGRFYRHINGHLRAGEEALIDVVTLCDYLQTAAAFAGVTVPYPPGQDGLIKTAAKCVKDVLVGDGVNPPLIKGKFEATDPSVVPVGFTGVSMLYKFERSWNLDSTLETAVDKSAYQQLSFAQQSAVQPLPTVTCWMVYAFEQSAVDTTYLNCS